ncbi:hypothetical protein [Helicobacter sp. 11S02629-2]|uniref:hypothetical protein n=1 Tax=Helicobacter sp. 11S02629-2 TaxID=1476195 RepID=UPI000BA64A88|nr:hypothetical protein [Helicobacter sp. 11S02629-2]PAF42391.1 hypothetical protein BKH40_07925 [Helicobacter sp. 11S02629-2]
MKKATKIILAASLIVSFSSMAMAATSHKRDRGLSRESISSSSNDISGIKFLLGAGVGTGLSADASNNRFSVQLAPNAGLDAKLKLGTGIFTTTRSSTLGLQATIGVGANSIGSTSSFNPQYSVNLDFIQAFKLGSTGYIKLGYILGAGVAIRTNDGGSNGRGNFRGDSVVGAAVVNFPGITNPNVAINNYTLPNPVAIPAGANDVYGVKNYNDAFNQIKQAYAAEQSGNFVSATSLIAQAQANASEFAKKYGAPMALVGRGPNAVAGAFDPYSAAGRNTGINVYRSGLGEDLLDTITSIANLITKDMLQKQVSTLQNQVTNLTNQLGTNPQTIEQQKQKIEELNKQIASLTTDKTNLTDKNTSLQNDLDTANNTTIPDLNKKIANLQQKVDDFNKHQIAAANNAKEEQDRLNAAKANSAPIILPTLKAGLIAFIGKHQAVSLEYQYYFRNTMPNTASSDISFNYTYYFGSN